jgi:hypothetical protein
MANRHPHKKLRAEVRFRMRTSGETYQQALACILSRLRGYPQPFPVPVLRGWIGARGVQ